MNVSQVDAMEFVRIVRKGLEYGFEAASLQLEQLELIDMGEKIITLSPSLYPWMFRGVVKNPMTGQQKEFRSQFQGAIGTTSVEDVKGLVLDIVEKTKKSFYG